MLALIPMHNKPPQFPSPLAPFGLLLTLDHDLVNQLLRYQMVDSGLLTRPLPTFMTGVCLGLVALLGGTSAHNNPSNSKTLLADQMAFIRGRVEIYDHKATMRKTK